MRTKTLLMAGAALAFSLATSQAQVYSANIVGYVNYVSTTVSPNFEMIDNPLDNGASNTLATLFPSLPGGTIVEVWGGTSFTPYTYTKLGHWGANAKVEIPPGQGFFISVGSGIVTNTFVGSVVPAVGLQGTNVIGTGFQAVSSMVPYAGSVSNTAAINLVVPGGTIVETWNAGSQTFTPYTFVGLSHKWTPSDLVISVGQGFFIENNSGSPINWVQTGP